MATNILKGTVEPTIARSNSGKDANAYFLMKLMEEPILPQDVYSVKQVARLLHISPDRLRSFAARDNHPFPIRHFKNGARGSFVLREEMIDWLMTNTISAEDEARERRKSKYDTTPSESSDTEAC